MSIDPRFAAARSAKLATVRADGRPHIVPIVFACTESHVYTAVDGKPKRHKSLLRLANIAAEPRVSLLADRYAEDWTELWWVRVDGTTTVHTEGEPVSIAHRLLRAKYPQYAEITLSPTVIAIEVDNTASWSAS